MIIDDNNNNDYNSNVSVLYFTYFIFIMFQEFKNVPVRASVN